MTKRLVSLMLAMLMLLVAFTSCADEGDALQNTMKEGSRYTSTINMWLITESPLVEKASDLLAQGYDPDNFVEEKVAERSDAEMAVYNALSAEQKMAWEQLDDIVEAFNKITKKRFKTQVNLKYVTAENYYSRVDAAFKELDKSGTASNDAAQEGSDEMVYGESGILELKYPEANPNQVDILFIDDVIKYREYADAERIADITDLVNDSTMKLCYYVSGNLLNAAMYNGAIYGVPNNHMVGEYTFLAVDESLANYYLTTAGKLGNSVFSNESYKFLNYVYEKSQLEANEGDKIYPIYSETGKVDLNLLHYWAFDPDSANENYLMSSNTFSIFGDFYDYNAVQGTQLECTNLLADQTYATNLSRKLYYETTPGYITTDPTQNAAIRIVKGDYATKQELEAQGYAVLAAELPRITDEEVFSSMFAVGAKTSNPTYTMQILAFLNTDAEIRNILQYGVEGENYTLKSFVDASGVECAYVEESVNNMYKMDITKTGNMFIAYPNAKETNLGEGKYGIDAWELGKAQNLEALSYPTVGMHFSKEPFKEGKEGYKVNDEHLRILNAVSAKVKTNVIDALATPDDVNKLYEKMKEVQSSNIEMAQRILDEIGETVTYVKAGETTPTQVTAMILSDVLAGMKETYSAEKTDPGYVYPAYVLYQEWLDSAGFGLKK